MVLVFFTLSFLSSCFGIDRTSGFSCSVMSKALFSFAIQTLSRFPRVSVCLLFFACCRLLFIIFFFCTISFDDERSEIKARWSREIRKAQTRLQLAPTSLLFQMNPKEKTEELTMEKCLQGLNAEQRRAVTCSIKQSALVLSGAGRLLCSPWLISFAVPCSRQWQNAGSHRSHRLFVETVPDQTLSDLRGDIYQ